MTPSDTAKQLRLAADILETGHPWEVRYPSHAAWYNAKPHTCPAVQVINNCTIRPILATPPDGRPLHNPHCLTAEQVGVGYRLLLEAEIDGEWHGDCEFLPTYDQDNWRSGRWRWDNTSSIRLPLSVPWPEAKPVSAPFQLPPPPPGMKWHREDGWQEGDLPQGWRPLALNEQEQVRDQWGGSGKAKKWYDVVADDCTRVLPHFNHRRTSRPLTFTHEGKTWTWHRSGDPMPCDGEAWVECLCDHSGTLDVVRAKVWSWKGNIIGWRYADEKKTVPQPSAFFLPGTVIRFPKGSDHWSVVETLAGTGIVAESKFYSFEELHALQAMANRSIPLTGRWGANAWEPCHKEITA